MHFRRTLIPIIAVVIALVVGTTASFVVPPLLVGGTPSSCNGGPYDAKVTLIGQDQLGKQLYNLIYYTKNDKQEDGLYYAFTSNALSWIKNNTSSNATFLNWWDYGKEIIGCTGRSSVISNPSAQLIAMKFDQNVTERDSNQSLVDVATALFTTNASLTKSIVTKYGANYIFITTEDGGTKAPYILQLLGLNPADYLTPSGTTFESRDWTSLGQQTMIYRLLSGQSVSGFNLVYSDTYVKIFGVSQ